MPKFIIGEECRYCGGNCPNEPDDSKHLCDGFAGDIDSLYVKKSEDDSMPMTTDKQSHLHSLFLAARDVVDSAESEGCESMYTVDSAELDLLREIVELLQPFYFKP